MRSYAARTNHKKVSKVMMLADRQSAGSIRGDQIVRMNLVYCALLCLCGVLPMVAQDASVQPQPLEISGALSRVYKSVNGSELRLHIFNPQKRGTTPAPAIVFFFGGGFTNGTVTQFTPQSNYLARRGMVAIVADYRVFARHGTSPFEA